MGFEWLAPVATIAGSFLQSNAQQDAANTAAGAQTEAARMGIEEQRRQFDAVRQLLSPYVNAGTGALGAQQNLIGLGGANAQKQAIEALQQSPEYQALSQSGQNAILANASATGGLRGGNVQAALGQFQPQLLSSLINNQYSRLGGLTSIGQNAAAGVGNAGMQTGTNIANLYGQQGAAQAGGALAAGRAQAGLFGQLGELAGLYSGGFGGPPPSSLGGSQPYSGMDTSQFGNYLNWGTPPIFRG